MTEEILEEILLGHIAKELKDEIAIGRQVNLAKTIMQALHIHGVVGRSKQLAVLVEWLKDHYSIDIPDRVIEEYKRYNG
jgi:hypothetical protein